jgi:hypothetical protein
MVACREALNSGKLTGPEQAVAYSNRGVSRRQNDPDPFKKKDQICEANFYSGELSLAKGLKEEATRLFRLAASECPHGFNEW